MQKKFSFEKKDNRFFARNIFFLGLIFFAKMKSLLRCKKWSYLYCIFRLLQKPLVDVCYFTTS